MKKMHLLIIIALMVGGCTDPELTRESFDQLKAENADLTSKVSELKNDASEHDRILANYSTRMTEILEQVSTLEQDELRIRDLGAKLSGSDDQERDWAADIGAEIDRIESALRDSEKRAEEINNELDAERGINDELRTLLSNQKTIIDQQNKKLSSLRTELKKLGEDFLALQEENTGLGMQVQADGSRIASLNEQVSELSEKLTVFVLSGTSRDLRQLRRDDILKSRFFRLEPHPAGISDGRVQRAFEAADPNDTTITIPGNITRLRVRSIHGKHPDLYTVKAVENGMQVSITSPDAFWALSRFLILEVK